MRSMRAPSEVIRVGSEVELDVTRMEARFGGRQWWRCREVAKEVVGFRRELSDQWCPGAKLRAQQRSPAAPHQPTQKFCPWPKGRCPFALPAATPEHKHPELLCHTPQRVAGSDRIGPRGRRRGRVDRQLDRLADDDKVDVGVHEYRVQAHKTLFK